MYAVFSLKCLDKQEHMLLVGPAGTSNTCSLARALGYATFFSGNTLRSVHTDVLFKSMSQARVDSSADHTFLSSDLLIPDDLGPHRLTPAVRGPVTS